MTRSTRGTVDAFFDALARRDWALMVELIHDDILYLPPASMMPEPFSGGDKALALLKRIDEIYRPGAVHHRDRLVVEGEEAVCLTTMEGVRKAGSPYRNRYIFVFRVRDGRIVEMEEHLDTLALDRIRQSEAQA